MGAPPAPYLPIDRLSRPEKALKEALPDFTNPKYIGPGVWFSIHTLARRATTYETKKAFVAYMNELRTAFPCPTCRGHLNKYLDTHSFEQYWNIRQASTGEDIGFFRYAWEFHNAVNIRLKKPLMDFETAKALYYDGDSGTCAADCADAH